MPQTEGNSTTSSSNPNSSAAKDGKDPSKDPSNAAGAGGRPSSRQQPINAVKVMVAQSPAPTLDGQEVGEFRLTQDDFFQMIERKSLEKYLEFGQTQGILAALGTDPVNGIHPSTIDVRVDFYGRNELPPKEQMSLLEIIWDALGDLMLRLLIVAAIISIIFGMTLPDSRTGEVDRKRGWIEGTAILISVTVVVLLSSVNDWQKAKKFAEISDLSAVKLVEVVREGMQQQIDSREVVVGDVMIVEGGQRLVADGVLIEGQDLRVDESAATGESDIMKKDLVKDPFFLSGTDVGEGMGRIVVTAVGEHSFSGKIALATQTEMAETPLQEKLGELAERIGKVGLALAIALLAAMCIKEGVKISKGEVSARAGTFLHFVILSITIIVVAIPEGLPLAVTIALAFSMKSMMKDNCLVRVLASCETMGAATAICSDKTGTLTKNQMTVVQGFVFNEAFVIPGYGIKGGPGATEWERGGKLKSQPHLLEQIAFSISVNSTADQKVEDGKTIWIGNKTEHGLLGFVLALGLSFSDLRHSVAATDKRTYPFSSAKKRMTTITRNSKKPGMTINVKGASEMVLEDCDRVLEASGEVSSMTEKRKAEIIRQIEDMANQGNRTIAVAYAEMPEWTDFPDEEPLEQYIFMGVVGIQDPIREEVPAAIASCHTAGITVRMVTGDNINTAKAIAKKCGIFVDEATDIAMQGDEFREMFKTAPDELLKRIPRLRVLARSSPTDKHVLVGLLMSLGEVVGVTGDGTNDAPALKLANVGLAMNSGTDVAKGASAMVLLDDCFATIVKAVVWGRTVNDNIRKFLQFQLVANIVGVVFTFIGSVASPDAEEPLTAVQLLWLNLIMDTLAAVALATEKPCQDSLARDPVYKSGPLITTRMWTFILGHAGCQLVLQLTNYWLGHKVFKVPLSDCTEKCNGVVMAKSPFNVGPCTPVFGEGDGEYCRLGMTHTTILFNTFIWLQIFNEINARKLYGEWNVLSGIWSRSRFFLIILFVICGFQVFAVEVAKDFMDTVALNWGQWLGCVAVGAFEIPIGVLIRLIPVKPYKPPPTDATETAELLTAELPPASPGGSADPNAPIVKSVDVERPASPVPALNMDGSGNNTNTAAARSPPPPVAKTPSGLGANPPVSARKTPRKYETPRNASKNAVVPVSARGGRRVSSGANVNANASGGVEDLEEGEDGLERAHSAAALRWSGLRSVFIRRDPLYGKKPVPTLTPQMRAQVEKERVEVELVTARTRAVELDRNRISSTSMSNLKHNSMGNLKQQPPAR